MLENSSSDEEGFEGNELAQRFDWSSPQRRKKNSPSKEDVMVANNSDGMYIQREVTYITRA